MRLPCSCDVNHWYGWLAYSTTISSTYYSTQYFTAFKFTKPHLFLQSAIRKIYGSAVHVYPTHASLDFGAIPLLFSLQVQTETWCMGLTLKLSQREFSPCICVTIATITHSVILFSPIHLFLSVVRATIQWVHALRNLIFRVTPTPSIRREM